MGNRSTIYSNLSDKFKSWLEKRGVDGRFAASNHYVANLKAIGEPIQPHTVKGAAWNGLYELLTGDRPNVGVFNVRSLGEFSANYGKAVSFFTVEKKAKEQVRLLYPTCANFDDLFDFAYDSTQGDGGHTKHAFVKYCQFLCELESQIITVTPGTALPLAFSSYGAYLSAIRTKPFVLLAGISGTGKSRLVRQLARGCCPSGHYLGKDSDGNVDSAKKPGNFEMIPVRPNWHDSTELMGYVTRLTANGSPKYVIKPFVKFLVKAAVFKDVPFFLCLDEMNLAPVEQYFAEYLSVVETRKKDGNDIVSDVLVDFDQPEINVEATVRELMKDWIDVTKDSQENPTVSAKADFPNAKTVYDAIIKDKGVRIPPNLVVMGTVNMDETTCSFSRKVLDRAMTFELNEVNMDEGLVGDNSIPYGAIRPEDALATYVEGCDFYQANTTICDTIKKYLVKINTVLDGTPFKFAYRSRNEIMLYCIERTKSGIVTLPQALDEATSMKVLSRIEGDDQKLMAPKHDADGNVVKDSGGKAETVRLLDELAATIPAALKEANGGTDPEPACTICMDKIAFMAGRLDSGFTNFFV